MIAGRVALFTLVFALAIGSGCSTSASPHYYTLDPVATPDGAAPEHISVMVGPVSIPAACDQPQLVVQVSQNRVEMEEFNRWAAPLSDGIARAVAGDLVVLLGTSNVTTAPLANFNPSYWVTINVQRFDSIKEEAVLVEAEWVIRRSRDGQTRFGRTTVREPTQGEGFDALAAAHSSALAKVSEDIAGAIRTEIADKT